MGNLRENELGDCEKRVRRWVKRPEFPGCASHKVENRCFAGKISAEKRIHREENVSAHIPAEGIAIPSTRAHTYPYPAYHLFVSA